MLALSQGSVDVADLDVNGVAVCRRVLRGRDRDFVRPLREHQDAIADADLAKAKGCLNCHDAEKKKVGPSFKEIAGKKKAAPELVAKLKEAKGHPKVNASDDEIKKLVDFVNATK